MRPITMGFVLVASFSDLMACGPPETSASRLSWTSSAAMPRRLSSRFPAYITQTLQTLFKIIDSFLSDRTRGRINAENTNPRGSRWLLRVRRD
jgi:hypothetical protein